MTNPSSRPCGSNAEEVCRPLGKYINATVCICKCSPGFAGDGYCCHPDLDGDGMFNPGNYTCLPQPPAMEDNCPTVPNGDQDDADGDGFGDSCEDDDDNDGIEDIIDNCPSVVNPGQEDRDYDRVGDVCDNCPDHRNTDQADADKTGFWDDEGNEEGDVCDMDDDKDNVFDILDSCPQTPNPAPVFLNVQNDKDNDGVGDECDNCPDIANPGQEDSDNNLIGDACDSETDSDQDGVPDILDNCPSVPNSAQCDIDNDGLGCACDEDADNDGIVNSEDNCFIISNPDQTDVNNDSIGDVCQLDSDGDGVLDKVDSDADGIDDFNDHFPLDSRRSKTDFNDIDNFNVGAMSPYPKAVWEIHNHGREVAQFENSRASMAVGRRMMEGLRYSGYIYVFDEDDDDVAGLVFNYQNNKNFYLLTATRTDSNQGFWRLLRVRCTSGPGHPSDALKDAIYKREMPNDEAVPGLTEILWQDKQDGWESRVAHFFEIEVRPFSERLSLKIWAGPRLMVDWATTDTGGLKGGRVGFYSHSQDLSYWTSLKTESVLPS